MPYLVIILSKPCWDQKKERKKAHFKKILNSQVFFFSYKAKITVTNDLQLFHFYNRREEKLSF